MTSRPRSPAPGNHPTSPQESERGQAAVEFALVLPIVVVMALGLVTIGIAVRNELAVELAAREGARAAAVAADARGAAETAATRAVRLPIDVTTTTTRAGTTELVTVTVTHVDPVDVAIIGALVGPVTHTATVTMAVEPPP
ncbi:MAG: TadE family protein [Ilumatobacteraceae bacterium]